MRWDARFDHNLQGHVRAICAPGRSAAQRDSAWQQLLAELAGPLETAIARSAILRRAGLATPDDVRAVMVEVIERLCEHDFRNLREFLARAEPDPDQVEETGLVEDLARCMAGDEPPEEAVPDDAPLRGWLRNLTRFAAKDHVKARFGWTSIARTTLIVTAGEPARLAAALRDLAGVLDVRIAEDGVLVMHRPGSVPPDALEHAAIERGFTVQRAQRRSKRDLYTGAERLATGDGGSERPPITDQLTANEVIAEVRAYVATLPDDIRRALGLWMNDTSFDDIARELGLPDGARARALVRAGHARLRERFRPSAAALFG